MIWHFYDAFVLAENWANGSRVKSSAQVVSHAALAGYFFRVPSYRRYRQETGGDALDAALRTAHQAEGRARTRLLIALQALSVLRILGGFRSSKIY